MPSSRLPVRTRRFRQISSLASMLALMGCGHLAPPPRPTPALQVQIPATIEQPCPRPDRTGVRTLGDLADYAIAATADLKVCDGYRDAAVAIIRAQNAAGEALAKALTPTPWWKVW